VSTRKITKKKNGSWTVQFTFRNAKVLGKPVYWTVDPDELDEAEKLVRMYDQLLVQGIAHKDLIAMRDGTARRSGRGQADLPRLRNLVDSYLQRVHVTDADRQQLDETIGEIGDSPVSSLDYSWAQAWITDVLKRRRALTEGTIRKYVGALRRALDDAVRHKDIVANPFHSLPKNYAAYTDDDMAAVEAAGLSVKEGDKRLFRFSFDDINRIRTVLAGGYVPERKQRPLELEQPDAMRLMFEIGLETAMRMNELYRLRVGQCRFDQDTIFLKDTKNTSRNKRTRATSRNREVPMTDRAKQLLRDYIQRHDLPAQDMLLPWYAEYPDKKARQVERQRVTGMLSHRWKRVFMHAGCPHHTFHCVRHEATSRLYEATDLREAEIMEITGHSTKEAHDLYRHLRGSHLAKKIGVKSLAPHAQG